MARSKFYLWCGSLVMLGACQLKDLQMDVSVLKTAGIAQNPVGVLRNSNNFCVATLLDTGEVLTADHCAVGSMEVRFQNPDGTKTIVKVKKIKKRFQTTFLEARPPLIKVLKSKDYALLDIGDASALIATYGAQKLVGEVEMKNSYDASRDSNHYLQGAFWLYRFSGESAKLEIQRGSANVQGAGEEADFFAKYTSFLVVDTNVGPQNSGAPFLFNNKIYGLLTRAAYKDTHEEKSGSASKAILTQALAVGTE